MVWKVGRRFVGRESRQLRPEVVAGQLSERVVIGRQLRPGMRDQWCDKSNASRLCEHAGRAISVTAAIFVQG